MQGTHMWEKYLMLPTIDQAQGKKKGQNVHCSYWSSPTLHPSLLVRHYCFFQLFTLFFLHLCFCGKKYWAEYEYFPHGLQLSACFYLHKTHSPFNFISPWRAPLWALSLHQEFAYDWIPEPQGARSLQLTSAWSVFRFHTSPSFHLPLADG